MSPYSIFIKETSVRDDQQFHRSVNRLLKLPENTPMPQTIVSLEKLHKKHQKKLGRDHQTTLLTLFNLTVMYHMTGQNEKALPHITVVVEYFQKIFPPNDTNVLLATKIQAGIFKDLGKYFEAKELLQRIINFETKVTFSPWNTDSVVRTLLEMGAVCEKLQEHHEALKNFIDAFELISNTYGLHHQSMWEVQAKIARLLFLLENHEDCLSILEVVLSSQRDTLGTSDQHYETTKKTLEWVANCTKTSGVERGFFEVVDDGRIMEPSTLEESAWIRKSMGLFHWKVGDLVKAEQYLHSCLALQVTIYRDNPMHEEIIKTKHLLSMVLVHLGFHSNGLRIMHIVLKSLEDSLGKDHPELIICKTNVAVINKLMGNFNDAYVHIQEAYQIAEKCLKKDDSLLFEVQHNKICIMISLGEEEGDILGNCKTLVENRTRVLGPRHQDTLSSQSVLSTVYNMQGKHRLAVETLTKVYDIRTEMLGPKHLITLTTMLDLLILRTNLGLPLDVAIQECSSLVLHFLKNTPKDHPETFRAKETLAIFSKMLGKHSDAVCLFDIILETRTASAGWHHPDTLMTLCELGETMERQGKLRGAYEVYREACLARMFILGERHPVVSDNLGKMSWAFILAFRNCRKLMF
ncbi:unnamed protein product [Allacma fusca]|uniref:Kinesin light chain n=1 Tax=Allacma fusca TaxID=39272 RepID=A0A8J2M7S3_9HEXA|nr:unnamed protein product [Allacma fusca]